MAWSMWALCEPWGRADGGVVGQLVAVDLGREPRVERHLDHLDGHMMAHVANAVHRGEGAPLRSGDAMTGRERAKGEERAR
jgi:hypothetical protein